MPRWKPEPDHMLDIYEISKRTGESVANIRMLIKRGRLIDAKPTRRGHRLYYHWANIKWQIENYQAKQAARRLAKLIK